MHSGKAQFAYRCQLFGKKYLFLSNTVQFKRYVYQLMGVFCNRLNSGSTLAPDCRNHQNKGSYCKKELSFLLVLLSAVLQNSFFLIRNVSLLSLTMNPPNHIVLLLTSLDLHNQFASHITNMLQLEEFFSKKTYFDNIILHTNIFTKYCPNCT